MARDFHDPANATDALGIRSGFDREAGERMASLVCLAPRNLRQRFRWRRLGVDYLAPTQARSMGISNGAAKSAPITADGTSALNRAFTSSRLHSSMEDVPMIIWIGIATA